MQRRRPALPDAVRLRGAHPGAGVPAGHRFFDGATELGDAEVTDAVIDEGLRIIRKLWDAGLAHRDIKPANLLVRDGRLLLIDVAFVETRPTPWRQAVDLANMMLCLALRSSPRQVYQRARTRFTDDEISEGFAAAHGLALPSQLRHLIRTQGRDLHAEFQTLLPSRPYRIKIQRWSPRRIGLLLLTAAALAVLGKVSYFVLVNNDVTTTPLAVAKIDCGQPDPLWLQAQSVPTASLVPCLNPLPAGWTFNTANVRNGWSTFILDHDRVGTQALVVRLTATCDTGGASSGPPASPAPTIRTAPAGSTPGPGPRGTPSSPAAASPPNSTRRPASTRASPMRSPPPSASPPATTRPRTRQTVQRTTPPRPTAYLPRPVMTSGRIGKRVSPHRA